ncbi:MAG: 2-oxoacid:ferredoxin oxidoreductase subunit beta, partial [Candidatus Kapaibacterium sp.]
VELHDGSHVALQKLSSEYDPTDRDSAMNAMEQSKSRGEILTGLMYIDTESRDLHDIIATCKRPLNELTEADLMPSVEQLEAINADHR